MIHNTIPFLSEDDIKKGLDKAGLSLRRRHPQILHTQGDEFNRVFNFMMQDSYMQPHLHPGDEKIEKIYLVQGKIATFFFDDFGKITQSTILERGKVEFVEVPAFTWHTYAILSDSAVTYETMMGVYDVSTWKKFVDWAPTEDNPESSSYLRYLKDQVLNTSL